MHIVVVYPSVFTNKTCVETVQRMGEYMYYNNGNSKQKSSTYRVILYGDNSTYRVVRFNHQHYALRYRIVKPIIHKKIYITSFAGDSVRAEIKKNLISRLYVFFSDFLHL